MATNRRTLDELESWTRRITQESRELTADLDEGQRQWRREPGRWGVADCFEHLIVTGGAYYPTLERLLASRHAVPALGGAGSYRVGWLGGFFARQAGHQGKGRRRAPKGLQPRPDSRPDAPERFAEQQQTLLRILAAARRADLDRTRLKIPTVPLPVRFGLGEILYVLVSHQQRHLDQARRVRQDPAFPES
ncbi:MAG TPA: DinB family protein [Thermoanaerobaculia bacterium]|nr:DinB family protein [Thermoanaerobaculia bacterium]